MTRLARNLKFNPLVPENWYNLSMDSVLPFKRISSILEYYKGSFARALGHLFPEIGLQTDKLLKLPDKYNYSLRTQRKVFINFAKENGFDPFVAQNWYTVSVRKIIKFKSTRQIIEAHGGLRKALYNVFPNIGLDPKKFARFDKYKHWLKLKNRRNFFVAFAQENGFNPFVPENWYNTDSSILQNNEIAAHLLHHFYDGDVGRALTALFPEVGFDLGMFSPNRLSGAYWKDENRQREFFLTYSREQKFDPLLPENWYSIPMRLFQIHKEGSYVVAHYDGNFAKALVHLFPDLAWDQAKFDFTSKNYWMDIGNRRKFFENFAAHNKFDPLVCTSWYDVSLLERVLDTKKSVSILNYYSKSLHQALMHLFPEIGLDPSKLPKRRLQH